MGAAAIIARPDESRLVGKKVHDLLLVPEVISARDRIDASAEQLTGGADCDPGSARGIFAIGNHQREAVLRSQLRHNLRDRLPARSAHDIAEGNPNAGAVPPSMGGAISYKNEKCLRRDLRLVGCSHPLPGIQKL